MLQHEPKTIAQGHSPPSQKSASLWNIFIGAVGGVSAGCGAGAPASNASRREISWKSALRRSTISSNAARCAFTNVSTAGRGCGALGVERGANARRSAAAPLLPCGQRQRGGYVSEANGGVP